MANFSKWNAKQDPRTELHDVLGLTGAEISINNLPAGILLVVWLCVQSVPADQ